MIRIGIPAVVAVAALSYAPVHAVVLTSEQTNQVAALTYQAAAAEASFKRQANAALTAQRGLIDAKVAELGAVRMKAAQSAKAAKELAASVARLQREISAAKFAFTAQLAEKDSEFARERAVLLAAGEKLAETAEGLEALTLFNAGGQENWVKAKLVLAQIEATREAKRRADAASDKRAAAELYEQARDKGYETLASVILKREAVVEADPSLSVDWQTLAVLYRAAARLDDALRATRNALAAAVTGRQRMVAQSDLAEILSRRGDTNAARAEFATAVAMGREVAAADPNSWKEQANLVATLHQYGDFLHHNGQLDASFALQNEALEIARKLLAADPESAFIKRMAFRSLRDVGGKYILRGNTPAATAHLQEALAMARAIVADDPTSLGAQRLLGGQLTLTGLLLMRDKKFADAEMLMSEKLMLSRKFVAADPQSVGDQVSLINALNGLALVLKDSGRPAAALQPYREALVLARRNANLPQSIYVAALNNVGDVFRMTGDAAGSRAHFEEMLPAARAMAQKDPVLTNRRRVAYALEGLAELGALKGGWPIVLAEIESFVDSKGVLAARDAEWRDRIKLKAKPSAAATLSPAPSVKQ